MANNPYDELEEPDPYKDDPQDDPYVDYQPDPTPRLASSNPRSYNVSMDVPTDVEPEAPDTRERTGLPDELDGYDEYQPDGSMGGASAQPSIDDIIRLLQNQFSQPSRPVGTGY